MSIYFDCEDCGKSTEAGQDGPYETREHGMVCQVCYSAWCDYEEHRAVSLMESREDR